MRFRPFAGLLLCSCAIWIVSVPAAQRHMSVEELRVGMTGTGRTAFRGTELEDFAVHILGVLRNTMGPRRDLILARLEGGPLAKTGVIAGMSGSPVYIEGRLVGAVSYSLGSFTTEPIAGITPIAEMIEATATAGAPAAPVPAIPMDAGPAAFLEILQHAIRPRLPFAAPGSGVLSIGAGQIDADLAARLRPIATPLSFGSLEAPAAAQLLDALGPAGFVGVPRSEPSRQAPAAGTSPPLRPGDPIGIELIGGDLSVAATGTVTDVDGSRVYAFGHAFFNLGAARLPMTRASVITVLPSLMSSTKVASTGEVIGAIVQDRITAVAGTLGLDPGTVPLSLTVNTARGGSRTFELTVADDPMLTPLFTYAALLNAFGSYERQIGTSTFSVRARLTVRGRGTIEYQDVLAGDSAPTDAAATVAVPLGALMTNVIEPLRVEKIDVDVRTDEQPRLATIHRVWLDSTDARPGRTVPLKVHLRTWRGDDLVETVPIDIPAGTPGPLTLLVADAQQFSQWEQREARQVGPGNSVDQLFRQLKQLRRNNILYVRLYTQGAGAVVNGEPMPALPSSVLAVLQGDRSSSGGSTMQSVVLGAWDIPLDRAVRGARTLPVPNGKRDRRP